MSKTKTTKKLLTDEDVIQNHTKDLETDGLGSVVKPWPSGDCVQLADDSTTVRDKNYDVRMDYHFDGKIRTTQIFGIKSMRFLDPAIDGRAGIEIKH